MKKLFYIMPGALDALNDGKPAYTPMTNHKTELHTVPMIAFSEYSNLIGIIENIKQWDICSHSSRLKIPHLVRIDMQNAILDFESIEKG